MPTGKKAQIAEFAETPLEGVNQILEIVNQPIPDVKTLGATDVLIEVKSCLLYTSPSPRDQRGSRMPSSA